MNRDQTLPARMAATSLKKEAKLKRSIDVLKDVMQNLTRTLERVEEESFAELSKKYITRPQDVTQGIDFYDEVRLFEIWLIQRALRYTGGRQNRAASLLGLKTSTLNAKIKAYEIEWREIA